MSCRLRKVKEQAKANPSMTGVLKKIYTKLYSCYGPQHWWPADTQFEVIVGAVLTQNTNWKNVEKALDNLRRHKLLTPHAIHKLSRSKLAKYIKPSGFFNLKAKRLKNFIDYLFDQHGGSLQKMKRQPLDKLRREFLDVNGIGPETADSILLYAFDKPIFVVDAYTKRIFSRHNIVPKNVTYHDLQDVFMKGLRTNAKLFNEYHALIVNLGKDYCKPKPLCERCPINAINYSLTNKCHRCHVASPKLSSLQKAKRQTKDRGSGLLCADCA